jgi:nitrogen fixation protein FixH
MDQPVELVSERYYEQSLEYDQRLAARANVLALGDVFTCRLSADGRTLVLRLPAGTEVAAGGTVTLYRPSDAARDRIEVLAPDAAGEQRLALASLATGLWRVQVQWEAAGRPYYFEQPLEIR